MGNGYLPAALEKNPGLPARIKGPVGESPMLLGSLRYYPKAQIRQGADWTARGRVVLHTLMPASLTSCVYLSIR
jgi:hypothetical protein